jgi:hypothetical protein
MKMDALQDLLTKQAQSAVTSYWSGLQQPSQPPAALPPVPPAGPAEITPHLDPFTPAQRMRRDVGNQARAFGNKARAFGGDIMDKMPQGVQDAGAGLKNWYEKLKVERPELAKMLLHGAIGAGGGALLGGGMAAMVPRDERGRRRRGVFSSALAGGALAGLGGAALTPGALEGLSNFFKKDPGPEPTVWGKVKAAPGVMGSKLQDHATKNVGFYGGAGYAGYKAWPKIQPRFAVPNLAQGSTARALARPTLVKLFDRGPIGRGMARSLMRSKQLWPVALALFGAGLLGKGLQNTVQDTVMGVRR